MDGRLERESVLSYDLNQIIDLREGNARSRFAGCNSTTMNGEPYWHCTERISFSAARERWWYIALARCEPSVGGKTGLRLEYTMHMMNGPPSDFLRHELSADEFYILPVDIAFFLVYLILVTLSIVCAVFLRNKQMFHTTYKMYMVAISLWTFGLFLFCIAWGCYGDSGWEESSTEVTGRLFQAAGTAVFLLMLLLMAKGYTITRGRLTQMSTVRLTIFFCLYIIVNITLFIWEGMFFDEGLVLYYYESPPGYGLVAMRIVCWIWFLYAFAFTMKHHPDKSKFYVPFFIFYTAWFWAGPIVIFIAIFAMAKWSRQKTVNGVEQFVGLCGHLFFLILTRPSAANSNFPFHLRTSQVRFSDEDDEPTQTYALSEESRQHLENIFVVQRNTALPKGEDSKHTYANGGYSSHPEESRNGSSRLGNGYNPALDATFTTQRNGQLPPLATSNHVPEAEPLPPLQNGKLPPVASAPPAED
ncbi:hypothetical protein BaRGS_00035655 [Batillaria attramentaria]|uniref:Intimal thickness related receptor IRP domain-containing protein n=1 Tax=Batillaria attramentaria TaxID=370345 RepID=A0ABD0JDS9_9CAEN